MIIPEIKVGELQLILQLLYTGSTLGESLSGLLLTLGSLFPELSFQVRYGTAYGTLAVGHLYR